MYAEALGLVLHPEGLRRIGGDHDGGAGPRGWLAVRPPELKRSVRLAIDVIALLVDRAVVAATEQGEGSRAWLGRRAPSG
jgi:hypothetical protein